MVKSGAEIEAPQRFLFWTRHRTVRPAQVAELLDQGVPLRMRFPEVEGTPPLLSAEDLAEAAVFQKVRPAPPGSEAEQLLTLADHGFRFDDRQGREIGPYGACNVLTDPARGRSGLTVRNGNGAIPVGDSATLGELIRFVQTSPLARLEGQGFQFFDPAGQVRPAFAVGPDCQVGWDGQPWLEAGDPTTLEQRVAEFSERLEKLDNDLGAAQRLTTFWEIGPDSVGRLLEGFSGERRERLARVALELMAERMDPVDFLRAGRAAVTPDDALLQRLWLEAIAPRHEGARVALAVHRQLDFARVPAWEAACGSEDAEAVARALLRGITTLSREERNALTQALLEGLALPVAREAASWKLQDPTWALTTILNEPGLDADRLASRCIRSWDREAQRRYLERLARRSDASLWVAPLLELHCNLTDDDACTAVFQAACTNPPAATCQDTLDFGKQLVAALKDQPAGGRDGVTIGRWILDRLARHEETSAAARTALQWQSPDALADASIALNHATARSEAELDRLADLVILGWGQRAQRRHMKQLAGRPGCSPLAVPLLKLHRSLTEFNCDSHPAIFRLACANLPAATGAEAACALQQLFRRLQDRSLTGAERVLLGEWALNLLARYPDTRPTVRSVQQWQVGDPYHAARAVADHPTLSAPEEQDALAMAAIASWDAHAQARHLRRMAARPGVPAWLPRLVDLHGTLKTDPNRGSLRSAVWSLAARSTSEDLSELAGTLHTLGLRRADLQILQDLLAEITAEQEARTTVQGSWEKNGSVGIGPKRVTVGGVVLRRTGARPDFRNM
ncbi:MAG: hypothetical protein AB1758_05210 [Candidatus Eremiobacterota bacterium]